MVTHICKRLLFVEDEPTTRSALTYLLEHEGYTVIPCATAEEAAKYMRWGNIDTALLDVRLPGRYGDDFGREFHEKHPAAQIIFLTAEDDLRSIRAAVPESLVIQKPIDLPALLHLLRGPGN